MKQILAAVLLALLGGCVSPAHVYLTWQGDTSTTMTVNFHTMESTDSTVYYDTVSRGGDIAAYASSVQGTEKQIPGLSDGRWIHTVELTGLTPGQTYYFAVGGGQPIAPERKFRTLPNDGSPIRFVDCGDVSELPGAVDLLQQAAAASPHFVEIGGDLAYEGGNLALAPLYDLWLSRWETNMMTPEGFTVPLIAVMGNHEANGQSTDPLQNAPFYFGYFAQGGQSNFARAIGPNAVLICLDSGHTQLWEAQVPWLRDTLKQNADRPFKFATYHVPLYPSYRPFDGDASVQGRTYWLPLFDEFGLTNAFEHHDHTFKRTKFLRGNAVDPEGTLYLGDGCFGQVPRTVTNAGAWYLEKASSTRHFWLVEVRADRVQYDAVDSKGENFDSVIVPKAL